MKAGLQAQIKPHAAPNAYDFAEANLKNGGAPVAGEGKIDFKNVLMNSSAEIVRKRTAQENGGDLATAKTDEEFYKMLNEQTSGPQRRPQNKLDKDAFLKLFVTQLQHQDPLNPDDSAKMASQMANFQSLEQMTNVHKTLQKMNKEQALGRAVGLIDFVGKEVRLQGGKLKFENGKVTEAAFSTEKAAANAVLEVRDASGTVISTNDLGNIAPGQHKVEWDGKMQDGKPAPNGIYTFAVVAKGLNDESIPMKITSNVKVTGVDLQDEGGSFFTDLGKINVADVDSVGTVGFAKSPEETSDEKGQGAADSKGRKAEANSVESDLKVSAADKSALESSADRGSDDGRTNDPASAKTKATAATSPEQSSDNKAKISDPPS